MPRKARITKEMVVDTAFALAREAGAENVTARAVAKKLGCSTQPIMYHFATLGALKQAAFEKADRFHLQYLLHVSKDEEEPLLAIGLHYIRFAVEEPHLFRFLFQSGYSMGSSLVEVIDSEPLKPLLLAMQQGMRLDMSQTKEVFITLAMFVHGSASLIVNNALPFDEALIAEHLKRVYAGALAAIKEEGK